MPSEGNSLKAEAEDVIKMASGNVTRRLPENVEPDNLDQFAVHLITKAQYLHPFYHNSWLFEDTRHVRLG